MNFFVQFPYFFVTVLVKFAVEDGHVILFSKFEVCKNLYNKSCILPKCMIELLLLLAKYYVQFG